MTTSFDIYIIQGCNYIGSTFDLENRRQSHNNSCNCPNDNTFNIKLYKFIRDNNIEIKLISIFRRNGDFKKRTMRLVEQFYIDKYDSIKNGLNMKNAYTNRKKWRKKYYLDNLEKQISYSKQYRLDNLYERKLYSKLYQRKRRLKKKDRDELNRKSRQKIICNICGATITKGCKSRHQRKTEKCLKIAREKAAMEL